MKIIVKILLPLLMFTTLIGFTSCEKEEQIQPYYFTIKPEDWTIRNETAHCKIDNFTNIENKILESYISRAFKHYNIELYTESGYTIPCDWYITKFTHRYTDYTHSDYVNVFSCQMTVGTNDLISKDFINEDIIVKIELK